MTQRNLRPDVRVIATLVGYPDVTFEPGSTHTAHITFINPTSVDWRYNSAIILAGVGLGLLQTPTVPAGGQVTVDFVVEMPTVAGTYPLTARVQEITTNEYLGEFTLDMVTIAALPHEFADLQITYPGAVPIPVDPDGPFQATLSFLHRGPAGNVWVGIGLAYGKALGHNPPFVYAMLPFAVPASDDWTSWAGIVARGTAPADMVLGKLLDAQRFISDSQPIVGQQPPNPYGVNDWDDEVFASTLIAPEVEFGSTTWDR